MGKFSVGVDIENIARFKKLDLKKNKVFFGRIYTKKEIEYCFLKSNPSQHLAARFAGKEAVLKAVSVFSKNNFFLPHKKIEIKNNKQGAPSVKINYNELKGLNIKISLSHCNDRAIAFAIASEK